MEVSKADWKLYREKVPIWQDQYMEKLVKEYADYLNKDGIDASEKFWELEKRIKKDKKHPGVLIELSKSEMPWDIVSFIKLKVIEMSDLDGFSDELKEFVGRLAESR